jgi:hypothetical protein
MTGHPRHRRQHRTLSGRKQASRGPPDKQTDRDAIGLGPGPAQQDSIPARATPEPSGSAPPAPSPPGGKMPPSGHEPTASRTRGIGGDK